jgi:hypothetical protein
MSSAPTDCRVPDPTDAKADGNFGNHRAGYGDRLDRIIATARKGWTLAAGEGLVLVQEIDRLREERDALQADILARSGFRTLWEIDHACVNNERDVALRILAALRNPSDLMVDALREQIYDLSCFDEALKAIRVAVAAAEQEVSNDR